MFRKQSLVEITELKADVIPSSDAGASKGISCPLAVCLCLPRNIRSSEPGHGSR